MNSTPGTRRQRPAAIQPIRSQSPRAPRRPFRACVRLRSTASSSSSSSEPTSLGSSDSSLSKPRWVLRLGRVSLVLCTTKIAKGRTVRAWSSPGDGLLSLPLVMKPAWRQDVIEHDVPHQQLIHIERRPLSIHAPRLHHSHLCSFDDDLSIDRCRTWIPNYRCVSANIPWPK
jgi:hypothetical protein